MSWIVVNIDWVLIVAGVLTASMILPFLAPRYATNTMFGEALDGPLANLVVRNWGQMIFASGLLLIWAAYDPASRTPILLFSIFGKLTFISLI